MRRWIKRIAGLLGTAALLGTGAAIAVMVIPSDGEDDVVAEAPAATPDEPKLTPGERRSRRAALATLAERGYEPVQLADYDAKADLRVLIGERDGVRRAFFFAGRRFVGTDAKSGSRRVRVIRSRRRTVTLEYRLYEPTDRPCCPRGGTAAVRFRLRGGALEPLDAVPGRALRLRTG